jgi:Ca2+-binding RTX toxin-like protein
MDYLIGLEGNDTLAAGGVSNTLDGQAGDDVLIGSKGTDGFGGEGRDLIQNVYYGYGDAGNDTITGGLDPFGSYRSDLHGGSGDDSIVGTSGVDFLSGGGGSNVINAGDGNDVFMMFDMYVHTAMSGYGSPVSGDGDPGFSTVDGGAGRDVLRLSEFYANSVGTSGNMTVDFATGVATTSAFTATGISIPAGRVNFTNFEDARTGAGNDSINGSSADNFLGGGGGSDTINGGAGNDSIDGATYGYSYDASGGTNLLRGEDGDDSIVGGGGVDRLEGGSGADRL